MKSRSLRNSTKNSSRFFLPWRYGLSWNTIHLPPCFPSRNIKKNAETYPTPMRDVVIEQPLKRKWKILNHSNSWRKNPLDSPLKKYELHNIRKKNLMPTYYKQIDAKTARANLTCNISNKLLRPSQLLENFLEILAWLTLPELNVAVYAVCCRKCCRALEE